MWQMVYQSVLDERRWDRRDEFIRKLCSFVRVVGSTSVASTSIHTCATCLFILLVWMSLTTLVGIVRKKSRLKFHCIRSHTEHRWASKMFAFLIVMRHRACMSESIEWNDHGGNSHWLSWLLKLIVLAAKIEKRKTKLKNPARRLYKHVCGGDDDGALAVTVYSVSVRKFSYTSHVKRNGRVSMPVAAVAAAAAAIYYYSFSARSFLNSLGRWLCLVCAFGALLVFDSNAPSERKNSKTEKWRCKTNISEQKKKPTNDSNRENTHTYNCVHEKRKHRNRNRIHVFTQHTERTVRAYIIIIFPIFLFLSLYIFYIKQHQQATNTQNHAKEMKIKVKLKNCIIQLMWFASTASNHYISTLKVREQKSKK